LEIKGKILFTPSKTLRRFSLNSQLLNGTAWKYLVWNFIKIEGKILKVQSAFKF